MQRKMGIIISRTNSRRALTFFVVALMFGVLAWASGEPWKGKPYDQWDDKDLQKIFTDSPWARITPVARTWRPISEKDLPNPVISGRDRPLPGDLAHSSETAFGGELNFYVYWASSRVMRAASARKAVLHGGKKDLDVDKSANEPQEEYQIVLQSEDMAPFVRHEEKFFQENSFLQIRKTKLKLSPSHVVYERDANGRLVTAAVFFFPKKTPSGDPTIAPDEKSVEFTCKVESSTLRVNFEPPRMVDQNGPAL